MSRKQDRSPPAAIFRLTDWLRSNLFSSPANALLTIAALYLIYATVPPVLEWAFFAADWEGDSREDCTSEGACWVFIRVRLAQFAYGFYPEHLYWRVNGVFVTLAVLVAPLFVRRFPWKRWLGIGLLFFYPYVAFLFLYGGVFGLEVVESHRWGGLMLTLIIAAVGIVAALPLGILLALGRRSQMPVVKALCIAFIELWRGVPLITVLFMASVMLPLFLP